METIRLQTKEEILQFQEYIHANPSALIKEEHITGYVRKYLANDQIVELPENKYGNVLVFGKDNTEEITNVSYKAGKIYKYFRNGQCQVDAYNPFVLTPGPTKTGTKLKGSQFYKYITHINDDKYNELKGQWNKDIYLPRTIEEGYMMLNGSTYFKGLKLADVSYLSFDIENLDEHNFDHKDLVVLISNTFRNNDGKTVKKLFSIKDYKNSVEMVQEWCRWVKAMDPDVVLGHNIFSHDLRILNLVTPLRLGRDDSNLEFETKASKFRKDGQQQYEYFNAHIHGRTVCDTLWLSFKYDIGRKFPSYGLKVIEKYLGLVDKNRIEWDFTENPVHKTMNDPELWKRFTQYSIDDADGPLKMIDIMLPSLFYFNQSVPKTLQQMINEATGSQLDSMMIRSYLQDGYSQPKTSQKAPFEGAISLGVSGIYHNVKKVDCLSMYPSIMLQYQIYDKNKDPNANILKILSYFRDERVKNKHLAKSTGDRYFEDLQQTQKVGANSIYGFLGAGYLLYNYPQGAADVTKHGREIISKATMWATGYELIKDVKHITNEGDEDQEIEYEWKVGEKTGPGKGYVVSNIDTDGLAITNGKASSKEDFEAEIKELNSIFPEYIKFENDGTFSKFIVVRAKNYIMLPEGETKYKLKGSSITDQKKEPALRLLLQELIECLLADNQEGLIDVYHKYVKESQNITDISRWSTKKTITKSVLNGSRKNETKVLDSIKNESFQEGDKIYLWNAIEGEVQKTTKGIPDFYKDGRPKLQANKVLKLNKYWIPGLEDKDHYLSRVYSTICILSNVVDITKFINYSKKKELLRELK
jgi:DNA polymerase I